MSWGKLKERSRALFIALNNGLSAHLQRHWHRAQKQEQRRHEGAGGARGAVEQHGCSRLHLELSFGSRFLSSCPTCQRWQQMPEKFLAISR